MSGKTLTYNKLINQHLEILRGLQYKTGLFAASSKKVGTGYDKSWIRDNFYECLAFEVINDWETVEKTYTALLGIFLKHEQKIDWAIKHKPQARHEYIHARFNPETFGEFWEEWGNKQNDSIGAILFKIGQLVHTYKKEILKNDDNLRIVQKLVWYLNSIEYWHDKDSGMWEEDEEIHASSVGACVAGLKMISKVEGIEIPGDLIQNGEVTLNNLLPRESNRKFVDIALLSLIYPYNIVSAHQRRQILTNIEYHLLKERGVIRYKNDYYYNKNVDQYSEEAEWTFGLSWLAIIYEELGDFEKAKEFINQIIPLDTDDGIPELYYSNSPEHNENNPLGWSESLFIISLYEMNNKHYSRLEA
ncbi:glycoside hydrolase family 15 [Candidatus Dojkabacteria bacterium]|nr:glycoside hydrolase family 15 [Candidatus Dojkabacteria bacterium]